MLDLRCSYSNDDSVKKLEISREQLRRMHWVENKSVKAMAKELGCSRAGIYNAMQRERVQWRGMSAAKIVMHAQTRLEERVA